MRWRSFVMSLALGGQVLVSLPTRAEEGFGLSQEEPDEATKQAEAAYRAGIRASKLGRNAEAIQHFEAALAGKSDSADLFYNLVQVTKLEKRLEKTTLYGQAFLLLEPDGKDSAAIRRDVDAAFVVLAKRDKPPVEVTINVPAGARAFVDDAPVVGAKQPVVRLAPGSYRLRVDKLDHQPFTQALVVQAAPLTIDVTLTAIAYTGTVLIKSKPEAGVDVFLDDRPLGKTPIAPLELPTGKKMLFRFEVPGYASWVRYVVLTKDETVTLTPVLEKVK